VEDAFLPENTGCYAVCFTKEGEVTVAHCQNKADLRVSLQSFTQLVLGFLDMEEAAYKPDVQITGNQDTLQTVFGKKLLFLEDFY